MKWNALWDECKIRAFSVGVWGGVGRAGPAAGGVDTEEKRVWGKKMCAESSRVVAAVDG